MSKMCKPPESAIYEFNNPTIFLAGSIEQGTAVDWQDQIGRKLVDLGWNVFNPRRDNWDSSWEQSITNPDFQQQVNWELHHLKRADYTLFYFQPNTLSPISLLELGLAAALKPFRTLTVCPEGFWRKGNVDIVCQTHSIPMYESLDEAVNVLRCIRRSL